MSEMRWFRMYTDAVDNPKLRLLAFEDRWHYVAICCLKRTGLQDFEDDPMLERKIAIKLGVQLRELDEIKRRLFEVDLIDEQWHPVGWDERQFISDSSTDRVRKYRKNQGKSGEKRKRSSNVTETVPSVSVSVVNSVNINNSKKSVVQRVFNHWKTTHNHPKAQLDPKRHKVISEALKNYDESDLCQAITGYLNSPFHMGQNDNGTVYDDIELFLRGAKQIDAGMRFHAEPPKPAEAEDPYIINLRRNQKCLPQTT